VAYFKTYFQIQVKLDFVGWPFIQLHLIWRNSVVKALERLCCVVSLFAYFSHVIFIMPNFARQFVLPCFIAYPWCRISSNEPLSIWFLCAVVEFRDKIERIEIRLFIYRHLRRYVCKGCPLPRTYQAATAAINISLKDTSSVSK
jgi:hypothetical protein